MSPPLNLRQFIKNLRDEREIVDIYEEVDPALEIAEIHRRIAAVDGPALFFHKVKDSSFPVTTNLFGSKKRVALAFQNQPERTLTSLTELLTQDFPPKLSTLWKKRKLLKKLLCLRTAFSRRSPVQEKVIFPADLDQLPLLKSWPLDGGHFITLPLVYTESPEGGPPNLGMYRIQRYNKKEAGLHFQIQKGGGFHYYQAQLANKPLPVSIFLGGPPALILSAIAPLPENIPEILMCAFMQEKKLSVSSSLTTPHPLISECEFALVGTSPPHVSRPEGPFGDHYGYYSWTHDFPIFKCDRIYHRKDAIYPATVVGKPRQEDFYIGDYLQQMLAPLFPLVMPGVKSLWSYGETGFHALSAAVVKERYYRECMTSAFRILGEGQLSLTKFLLLTNQEVNVCNFKEVLTCILERFNPETDLFIFANLSLDTLDYTGPALNKGSRGIMLGIGEKVRDLPHEFIGRLPNKISQARAFSPGCLVLQADAMIQAEEMDQLLTHSDFSTWPLLILVDNVSKALKSDTAFLWTVFTRFEPAADIYAAAKKIIRNHVSYKGPILIDARMKPSYPPPLSCDPMTAKTVSEKWLRYFPNGMEMGNSDTAHAV